MGYKVDGKYFGSKELLIEYIEKEQQKYEEEGLYKLTDFKDDIEGIIKGHKNKVLGDGDVGITVRYKNNEQYMVVESNSYITNLKFDIRGKVNKEKAKGNLDFTCKNMLRVKKVLKEIDEIVKGKYDINHVQVDGIMDGNTLDKIKLDVLLSSVDSTQPKYVHLNSFYIRRPIGCSDSDIKYKETQNNEVLEYLNHVRFRLNKAVKGKVSKDNTNKWRIGSLDVMVELYKLVE